MLNSKSCIYGLTLLIILSLINSESQDDNMPLVKDVLSKPSDYNNY